MLVSLCQQKQNDMYKGLPKKLNVIKELTIDNVTYLLVNGYKDINKVVGYNNNNSDKRFISYINTQFKNIESANNWLNSKNI